MWGQQPRLSAERSSAVGTLLHPWPSAMRAARTNSVIGMRPQFSELGIRTETNQEDCSRRAEKHQHD